MQYCSAYMLKVAFKVAQQALLREYLRVLKGRWLVAADTGQVSLLPDFSRVRVLHSLVGGLIQFLF